MGREALQVNPVLQSALVRLERRGLGPREQRVETQSRPLERTIDALRDLFALVLQNVARAFA
jgi:hypothetical protein